MASTTYIDPRSGRTFHSDAPRPFFVRTRSRGTDRYFGSADKAVTYLRTLSWGQVFFEYAPGCGTLVEKI